MQLHRWLHRGPTPEPCVKGQRWSFNPSYYADRNTQSSVSSNAAPQAKPVATITYYTPLYNQHRGASVWKPVEDRT